MSAIEIRGLPELKRAFRDVAGDLEDLKDAFNAIGREVTNLASRLAPHKSGKLAANIRPNRSANQVVIRSGGKSVPYATIQHWGSSKRHIKPTLYLRRADQQMMDEYPKLIEDNVAKALQEKGLT